MKKRTLAILVAMVMLLGAVAGCTKAPAVDPNTESPSVGTQTPAGNNDTGNQEEIKLTFLNVFPMDETNPHFEKYIDQFEADHPGVTVEYTTVPWDEAFKKVVAMSASDTLPDVLTGDVSYLLALAPDDKILDLTQAWTDSGYYADLCTAGVQSSDLFTYDGKVYAIPDGYGAQGIYVNVNMLEAAGYSIDDLRANWTWDKYFEVVRATTSGNEFGMSFRGGPNGFMRFYEYLCNRLNVDSMFPNGNNVSILEDPKALDYFKEFYGLYVDGYAPKDSITWGFKEMVEGFVSYQTATLNNSAEVTLTCSQRMQDGDWTVLPFPKNADGSKTKMVWGHSAGMMVSANTEYPDLAKELVMYLSSPEVNAEYCKALTALPIYNQMLGDPYFQEGYLKGFADTLQDPNLQYLTQPTQLTQWGYFISEYASGECQKYMAGQQSAEDTLKNLAAWLSKEYDTDVTGG